MSAAVGNPVLRVEGLRLRRGTREILRGVDLAVDAGEIVALMGLSGSGKTTLLRVIAGLETADAGSVSAARVGLVFQAHCLFEHLSTLRNVTLAPLHVQRLGRAEAERRARTLLEQLGVGHRADALPCELSGGEAQRVSIARALAMDPPLLLLDEPTASLDPARRQELAAALAALAAAGRTLLLTSHDEAFVRACAGRVLVLSDGRVVEAGPPDEVLTRPQHPATRQLLQAEGRRARDGS